MTLSLDDVRSKRFRMARKSGYEVLEVDEFVDEVEATFEQLFEENENLKKQVESLKSTAPSPGAAPSGAPIPSSSAAASAPAASAPAASAQTTSAPAAVASEPAERIVVTTAKEASPAVVRLVQLSTEQAEQLVAEATADAARIRDEAASSAEQVTGSARAAAERVEAEARARAEKLQADAVGRSESLDRETGTRRTEMVSELEQQRDQLAATVNALRSFEATYRSNLTSHLQDQIEVLASGHEEPADPPAGLASARPVDAAGPAAPADAAAAGSTPVRDTDADDAPTGGGGSTSDTPRLDALLGDQR